jgi:phosphoglycolate phosphatase
LIQIKAWSAGLLHKASGQGARAARGLFQRGAEGRVTGVAASSLLAMIDCDGTLVDSQGTIEACLSTAYRVVGLAPPTQTVMKRFSGLPLQDSIQGMSPTLGDDIVAAIVAACRQRYFDLRRESGQVDPLIPGALAALKAIAVTGWQLGIASSRSRPVLDTMLDAHGIRARFATIQTGDAGPPKPDPAMLLRAMQEMQTLRQATVMIGDTVPDMQMARRAGVWAIGVGWGNHRADDLMRAGADRIVGTFAELPGALSRIGALALRLGGSATSRPAVFPAVPPGPG